jgi:membrane-associated phospholipid phosphatase
MRRWVLIILSFLSLSLKAQIINNSDSVFTDTNVELYESEQGIQEGLSKDSIPEIRPQSDTVLTDTTELSDRINVIKDASPVRSINNIFFEDPIIYPAKSVNLRLNNSSEKNHIYRVRWGVNTPIIAGTLIANYFGLKILTAKKGPSEEEIAEFTPDKIHWINRSAALMDPAIADKADSNSDLVMYGSFVLPAFLLLNKNIREDAGNTATVYLTTIGIMTVAYSWGVGHIDKYRPFVYNTREDISRRTSGNARNSFYGGHAAATASVTFFLAKSFHDHNPGSKLTPFLFAAALIPPAYVGYQRQRAGMHFLTDNIAGITAGAIYGIVIPQLHKRKEYKKKNLSFTPITGPYTGFAANYTF